MDPSYLSAVKSGRFLIGRIYFESLDSDSGSTNEPQRSSEACRGPEQTYQPLCLNVVLLPSMPAAVVGLKRRRCGGR